MIDIANEQLIPIREVPRRLPPRPTGRPVHISAVYRWVQRGIRGTCLEAIRIGGNTYTSIEALQRFGNRLNEASNGTQQATSPIRTVTRQKQIDQATRQLEQILASGHNKKYRR